MGGWYISSVSRGCGLLLSAGACRESGGEEGSRCYEEEGDEMKIGKHLDRE